MKFNYNVALVTATILISVAVATGLIPLTPVTVSSNSANISLYTSAFDILSSWGTIMTTVIVAITALTLISILFGIKDGGDTDSEVDEDEDNNSDEDNFDEDEGDTDEEDTDKQDTEPNKNHVHKTSESIFAKRDQEIRRFHEKRRK